MPSQTPQPIVGVAGIAAGKASQSGRLPAESVGSALKVTWECFCFDYGLLCSLTMTLLVDRGS